LPADPQLIRAWLEGRSMARNLPGPVAEYGGFRIDTASESEIRRWVFPDVVDGIGQLARTIDEPRHLIKLCGTADALASALPPNWAVEGGRWFMVCDSDAQTFAPLPVGYTLGRSREGAVTKAEVRTDSGELAASGFAAETADAFVYDRIETDPRHRRRGLGRAVMAALASRSPSSPALQLLVATTDGERLYSSLGWRRISAYSTAFLPES
jgi:GNAT superfamily N-acetyltransferase